MHPTSELFYNSCILKLEDNHEFELAVFMYKNHCLPIYLEQLLLRGLRKIKGEKSRGKRLDFFIAAAEEAFD